MTPPTQKPWLPEHPVDRELAERLLDAQFPELPRGELELLGSGWDNDVWRRGDLVWRFPRRELGARLIDIEIAVMPGLAPLLPVPVPMPLHVGQPAAGYPARFLGHAFLPGVTADRLGLDDDARARLAVPIARFLRALHAIPVAHARLLGAFASATHSDVGRRARLALERAPLLEATVHAEAVARAAALLRVAPPPHDARLTLIHGDFYARHLLLDSRRELCGVIDWGDVCLGDPAIDLNIATTFLPLSARAAFWEAYGAVSPTTRARARLSGLASYGVSLLAYAVDIADPLLERDAAFALAASLH